MQPSEPGWGEKVSKVFGGRACHKGIVLFNGMGLAQQMLSKTSFN